MAATCRGPARRFPHAHRDSAHCRARFLSGASVRWIDCQPDTCQRIYFANHTSHLDMMLVWSALPHDVRRLTRPVAAKDYWDRGPLRRYMAKTFNAMLVDRKEIKVHQSPVDMMLREIGTTHSLIMFPEGGRSTGETGGRVQERTVLSEQEAARPGAGAGVHRQHEPRAAARRVLAGAAVVVHHVRAADVARGGRTEERFPDARPRGGRSDSKEVD